MRSLGFLLVFCFGLCQAQISEDFADNNLLSAPVWSGDLAKFTTDNFQLRSASNTASDLFYISTSNTLLGETEWEFYVNMKFNTSSANYSDFYLVSSDPNLSNNLDGYFVRVGNTSDEISLYKTENSGVETELIDGPDGETHNKEIRIRVRRDVSGNWVLDRDLSGGFNFSTVGSATDNTYNSTVAFGIKIRQSTTSFHNKHFFDDIYLGPYRLDTVGPKVISAQMVSSTSIEIEWNEPLQSSTVLNSAFDLSNGYGNPMSATFVSATKIALTWPSNFTNGAYTLDITSIQDSIGNQMDDTSLNLNYFVGQIPHTYDVLITEIFADPSPAVALPAEEFIELYNASSIDVELGGCIYSDATSSVVLPSYVLTAGAYVILCDKADSLLFQSIGPTLPLPSWPSLNNSGDDLTILNISGDYLHNVSYADDWYGNDLKSSGGWTLEMIDPSNPCLGESNWTASNNPAGGTPSALNSVDAANPDLDAPFAINASLNNNTVEVRFNEVVDSNSAKNISNYTLLSSIINPVAISIVSPSIVELDFSNTSFNTGIVYELLVEGVEDCSGNSSQPDTFLFAISEMAQEEDVIINEILFNPKTGGVDFVEIYNMSDKVIDLKELLISRKVDGQVESPKQLSTVSLLLFPKSYAALTEDRDVLLNQYDSENSNAVIEVEDLPTLPNDEGNLLLLNLSQTILDELNYTEDMHYALLDDFDGISLERISINRPSIDQTNWHSAASNVGFATPGYLNSQSQVASISEGDFRLTNESFSPDNDGFEDVLTIQYSLPALGYTMNLYVYDIKGRRIAQIARNELINAEGFYSWDGVTDQNTKIRVGNYIILVETFDLDGNLFRKKIPFSVSSNF